MIAANQDVVILVASCDAYQDLWTPFFRLLDRHWPDRPFAVYLGAGMSSSAPDGVTILRSSAGRDWSGCMIDYLGQIHEPYVLVTLDDFFLRNRVDTSLVLDCVAFARANQAIQVRLIPRPKPTHHLPSETLIGECEAGSPYRLSTQAAIWNRTKLLALLRSGESIWSFEHNGNARCAAIPHGFYSVWQPVLPYEGCFAHHVIEKGKWLLHEKCIFAWSDIGCDFARRETLPLSQTLLYQAAQALDRSLAWLPWRTKRNVKQRLKVMLEPFFRAYFRKMGGMPKPPP
jgi:hypothetical protein